MGEKEVELKSGLDVLHENLRIGNGYLHLYLEDNRIRAVSNIPLSSLAPLIPVDTLLPSLLDWFKKK